MSVYGCIAAWRYDEAAGRKTLSPVRRAFASRPLAFTRLRHHRRWQTAGCSKPHRRKGATRMTRMWRIQRIVPGEVPEVGTRRFCFLPCSRPVVAPHKEESAAIRSIRVSRVAPKSVGPARGRSHLLCGGQPEGGKTAAYRSTRPRGLRSGSRREPLRQRRDGRLGKCQPKSHRTSR